MKEYRIVLTQNDFQNLVSGNEIVKNEGHKIRIILSDIGFQQMEYAIERAVRNDVQYGKLNYNPEDDLKGSF